MSFNSRFLHALKRHGKTHYRYYSEKTRTMETERQMPLLARPDKGLKTVEKRRSSGFAPYLTGRESI
ncbi:hypothetical protein QS257_10000 [Terrilactibacillus sp. S3-3]|nr:hypothetical protein QS257_10000 [Terrilactibacillus sp. S3-3]